MKRALANAEQGWGQTAPNPMVGAVVVSGSEVIADGWHARYGEAHAEVMAIARAGPRARGASLYATLEPCAHHGKTPPCVDAIIAAGISRVVVAVRDPNPAAGGGVEKLRAAGVDVEVGTEEDAAIELNAPFFNAFSSKRPWVTLKLAVSADGGVADPTGERRWITGEAARREVHRMRANVDAVVVGVGTVIADDPELTVRDFQRPRCQPTRVVFDSRLRTPRASKVVQTAAAVPTIVIAPEAGRERALLERLGVAVITAPSIGDALVQLRDRDIRSILLEGGPRLAGAFLSEGCVDRVALFTAPFTLGPDAPQAFAFAPAGFTDALEAGRVVDERRFDEDSLRIRALTELPKPH
jgi:diaminohydroxyphosphoribosylaminopyrimidine deaminase/5-amino-6-(5-phosphoribosylamino)uracil reductase